MTHHITTDTTGRKSISNNDGHNTSIEKMEFKSANMRLKHSLAAQSKNLKKKMNKKKSSEFRSINEHKRSRNNFGREFRSQTRQDVSRIKNPKINHAKIELYKTEDHLESK